MEHNSFGLIFFLTILSVGYVSVTGGINRAMAHDATAETKQKFVVSLITLPLLGIAVTLSYPHYTIGLAGAGITLGFILTLSRITYGIAALTTEPMAVGMLYLMAQRSSVGGDAASQVESVLARFGYHLTSDHLGYLTGGIAAGIVIGFVPRMLLKSREFHKANEPQMSARQRQLKKGKKQTEKVSRKGYSRKTRALADRVQALK